MEEANRAAPKELTPLPYQRWSLPLRNFPVLIKAFSHLFMPLLPPLKQHDRLSTYPSSAVNLKKDAQLGTEDAIT